MYAILSGGALIALCDKPRYVKKNARSGVYIETDKTNAIGIAVSGKLYNIDGKNEIPDAPQAIVTQGDGSEYIFRNRARITENEATTNAAVVEIENALCDIDMAAEERLTILEDALCELDGAINE